MIKKSSNSPKEKIRMIAKGEYIEHLNYYDKTPSKIKRVDYCNSMLKSHCDIHYGIYSKNKGLFDDGVSNYSKYSLIQFEILSDALTSGCDVCLFSDNPKIIEYKNEELLRQMGEQMQYYYHHYTTVIPNILSKHGYWD